MGGRDSPSPLVEQFIASHRRAPRELVIDFDATDDLVHGHQLGRFFHGYYDRYCFLPLYAFCGRQLLVAYLRPSNIDATRHTWAVLSLLVRRFRRAWLRVRIVLRGDSAFCRHRMLDWCDRHRVGYIVGLARNAVLERRVQPSSEAAEHGFRATRHKVRLFTEFAYAARTWRRSRRVIARIEYGPKGRNPRFIVTNLEGQAKELYERVYCQRGEMENRIKEQQLDLFADRTLCTRWWANQYRVLLAALATAIFCIAGLVRVVGRRSDGLERKARVGEAGSVASGVGERSGTRFGLKRDAEVAVRTPRSHRGYRRAKTRGGVIKA